VIRSVTRRAAARAIAVCLSALLFAAVLQATRAEEPDEAPDISRYDEAVDEAIDAALAYLAGAQKEDGSFPSSWDKNSGIAALCVMAFLSKGYTPGTGPYGEHINRAIDFVFSSRRDNGMLCGQRHSQGPMYEHSISTLMLSEVSGMVDAERQARIDEMLPEALRIILAAQKVEKLEVHRGGWRYQADSRDSDISTTGWPLMALRSARNSGAQVPREAIDYAMEYIMRCRTRDGGFAYQPGQGPGPARTGVALLCLELCGRHGDEAAVGAAEWILAHPPRGPGERWFYYAIYYCSQGMYQLGDEYWKPFAEWLYETLLREQREDGSWPAGAAGREGECYATAMSVLALGVPYCQLPIYQR
jgi:hypothetical protein